MPVEPIAPEWIDRFSATSWNPQSDPVYDTRLGRFYATNLKGPRKLIGEEHTNSYGVAALRYAATAYTKFDAVFPSDESYESSRSGATVVEARNRVEGSCSSTTALRGSTVSTMTRRPSSTWPGSSQTTPGSH